ncbi:hypothetical protein WR25_02867 [Diploscapter pachys]|uniref:Uncharacterized protein n=1 Tax=Diploscapter pachys TaxID=2018661 RepID=A0A2A2KQ40_9BILA|nr:hypothetical protein WR25_02867 [Diploscapter pachys]
MSIKKDENNTNPPTDEQKKKQQKAEEEEKKNLPSPFPSEDSGMFTPTSKIKSEFGAWYACSPAQQSVITANLGLQKLEDYAEQSIRVLPQINFDEAILILLLLEIALAFCLSSLFCVQITCAFRAGLDKSLSLSLRVLGDPVFDFDLGLDQRTSGEALNECTDAEWLSGEDAYPQELLEVKKKPNKVSVFVARGGQGGSNTKTARDRSPSPGGRRDDTKRDDIDAVTKLVSRITKVFLEDKNTEGVKVQVTMRVANGPRKNLTE